MVRIEFYKITIRVWCANGFAVFNCLVLKTRLDDAGFLGKLKAQIRAEIFKVLESDGPLPDTTKNQPTPTGETLLVHELLRDTLEWFGYSNTLSVFLQESGHNADKLERKVMASELGMLQAHNEQPDVSLLLAMVAVLRSQKLRSMDNRNNSAAVSRLPAKNMSSRLFHVPEADGDSDDDDDDSTNAPAKIDNQQQVFFQKRPVTFEQQQDIKRLPVPSVLANQQATTEVYTPPNVQHSFSSDQGTTMHEPVVFQK